MSSRKIGLNKILGAFPTLERDERLDLVQQLEQSAQAFWIIKVIKQSFLRRKSNEIAI